jgi:hypothetical protein
VPDLRPGREGQPNGRAQLALVRTVAGNPAAAANVAQGRAAGHIGDWGRSDPIANRWVQHGAERFGW